MVPGLRLLAPHGRHLPGARSLRVGQAGATSGGRTDRPPARTREAPAGASAARSGGRFAPASRRRTRAGRRHVRGPERAEAALGVGAPRRTHVRAAGTRLTEATYRHARAGRRPFPAPSSAQLGPAGTGSGSRHREAAHRPPRAAEGRGRPRIVPPQRPALPFPSPGRGAVPPQPRNVGSRPAFVSRRLAP